MNILVLQPRKNGSYILDVTGRDFDEQTLGIEFINEHWTIEGDAKEVFMSHQRQQILQVLQENEGEAMTPKEIAESLDEQSGTIRRLLYSMVAV